ncbi:MshB deacetylase [Corynebacterium kutscheri]|uniref:1D-myo-inositol 2-acetamido-2-deoxy-alpha-D-glucopyranoside deacetylase n=1 Tax=Corynebacterium kutscheri TaxID=35755 RepID=A0A0F6TE32_9CORY|nr:N-acetyl-1-D-myo-inositol-2-amino-2-deoxy-alpha-D-glucopyranoside deacetylase [Corynebacterium kutscheri]AKE41726.1 N-acetyl-1-D-myo-inositol-2-amino-2-deoxy-alpha-D-glucopyranoside deacetylase [Corynebacterium kutscheri]VEH09002.1 MshB deacetylase [Corynebacterium kutscheri]VEH10053.1 MshB deacetylase [Corynebacterium kutscheri]VEH80134.1 MshB deacetylase [Corynebacterium kutscheri]
MNNRDLVGLSVVAVHAHPDDEAIWTGGALAQLARRGADITVVTCTLGEQGEVIGKPFSHLVADQADQLGGFRIAELEKSLATLGVRGEFLGGAGYWRDSGMKGDPANEHPRAFIHSGGKAVAQLIEIFQRLSPQLVITYGPDGGYGHPDHIRAHHIVHEAAQVVTIPRILWAVTSREHLQHGLQQFTTPVGWKTAREAEIACVDEVDIKVELSELDVAAKVAAMRAHPTQLWIADGSISKVNPHSVVASISNPSEVPYVFALSNLIAQPLLRQEFYQYGGGEDPTAQPREIAAGLL